MKTNTKEVPVFSPFSFKAEKNQELKSLSSFTDDLNRLLSDYNYLAVNPVNDILKASDEEIKISFIKDSFLKLGLNPEEVFKINNIEREVSSFLSKLVEYKNNDFNKFLILKDGHFIIDRRAFDIDFHKRNHKELKDKKEIELYDSLQNAIDLILNNIPNSHSSYNRLKKELKIVPHNNDNRIVFGHFKHYVINNNFKR